MVSFSKRPCKVENCEAGVLSYHGVSSRYFHQVIAYWIFQKAKRNARYEYFDLRGRVGISNKNVFYDINFGSRRDTIRWKNEETSSSIRRNDESSLIERNEELSSLIRRNEEWSLIWKNEKSPWIGEVKESYMHYCHLFCDIKVDSWYSYKVFL